MNANDVGAGIAGVRQMSASISDLKPGDRVRYKFAHRDTGTIVRRWVAGGWYVRWDNDPHGPRNLPAYDDNLEPLGEKPDEGVRGRDRQGLVSGVSPSASRDSSVK